MPVFSPVLALSTLSCIALIFWLPTVFRFTTRDIQFHSSADPDYRPDFSHYVPLRILAEQDFPLNVPGKRVVVVGDIHGMIHSLNTLLDALSYDSTKDSLIHVGDIITKTPLSSSLATLSFLSLNNITGVRGNYDQRVIEWYSWIQWIMSFPGGPEWLDSLDARWRSKHSQNQWNWEELISWTSARKRRDKKWWALVPHHWDLRSEPYRLARSLSPTHIQYLLSLPLRLYVPSAHLYIVHAGMLPSNPKYKFWDARQPLARTPEIEDAVDEERRTVQELSLLTEVPQNDQPWVVLNMRSVRGDEVTRSSRGTPWSDLWQRDMEHCQGYHFSDTLKKHSLPCHPINIIYGHTAARGLDVKRWSFGLDTGCVYGRKLTALVLGKDIENDRSWTQENIENGEDSFNDIRNDDDDDEIDVTKKKQKKKQKKNRPKHGAIVPFGDNGKARIFNVKC